MTWLVFRLAELRRYLAHARSLAPRVPDHAALERDLSLHNDVLYTLLMIAQLVIDIAGELSSRRGDAFEDYTQAIRNLTRDPRFPPALIHALERLPGFRNVVIHEYVRLDLARAVEALHDLDSLDQFLAIVRTMEDTPSAGPD
jgi:uncharacterized protein YutE (UPF0331/DUF86 family)